MPGTSTPYGVRRVGCSGVDGSLATATGALLVSCGLHQQAKEQHISEPRINDRIRVPEVRLVGPNGEQVGIVRVEDALRLAQEADLDLVEVAPTARPPVCKLMDFGKYKYEAALKERAARKNQINTVIKEIKLRPKIDPHDYGTKKGHVVRFLTAGDKVKVTIMFRGREQSRPELGFRLLQRLAEDVAELGFVESSPKQDGRNMIMVLGPTKKKAEARAEDRRRRSAEDDAAAERAEVEEAIATSSSPPAAPVPSVQPAAVAPAAVESVAVESVAVAVVVDADVDDAVDAAVESAAPQGEPAEPEPAELATKLAAKPPAAKAAAVPRPATAKPAAAAKPATAKPATAKAATANPATAKAAVAKPAATPKPAAGSDTAAKAVPRPGPRPKAATDAAPSGQS